ncbi:translation initiation factor IF-2-like [Lutra lutra]|uniref:translation initiation factor IF-2-like n=1 Tax=Lutra lutra TaxID=9657 RepID=UPI001FCFCA0A|nr:translation initiation factor IF-2-like [Lutra lutra]
MPKFRSGRGRASGKGRSWEARALATEDALGPRCAGAPKVPSRSGSACFWLETQRPRCQREGGGRGLCSETPLLACLRLSFPLPERLGGPPWPRPQPPASPRGARPLGEGAAGAGSSAPLPRPRLGRGPGRSLGSVPRACRRAVTKVRAPLLCRPRRPPIPRTARREEPAADAETETATAAGAARWRWNGGVNACVLKHQTVSRLLLDSRENASPEHALGVRFGPSALPGSLEAPRGPHPAFWDVCQGGSRDPDGSLPAPLARSTLARRLLFFFLLGHSAKGLRKLPAPGPSGARSGGPRHAPGRARPAPPAPSPGPLRPRRDPSELAASRAAPSGGGVERSSSPSRTPEPHAERAVSPPEPLRSPAPCAASMCPCSA